MWKTRFQRLSTWCPEDLSGDSIDLSLKVIREAVNNQRTRTRAKIMSANRIANSSFEVMFDSQY